MSRELQKSGSPILCICSPEPKLSREGRREPIEPSQGILWLHGELQIAQISASPALTVFWGVREVSDKRRGSKLILGPLDVVRREEMEGHGLATRRSAEAREGWKGGQRRKVGWTAVQVQGTACALCLFVHLYNSVLHCHEDIPFDWQAMLCDLICDQVLWVQETFAVATKQTECVNLRGE